MTSAPVPRGGAGAGQQRPVPERVRTPLLQLITQESLDVDYQYVAQRRGAGRPAGAHPQRSRATVTAAVVAVFGILLALAAVQTSRTAPAAQTSKEDLIARVSAGRAALAAQQQQIQSLKHEISTGQHHNAALGTTLAGMQATVSRLQQSTGFGPVSGGGVVVTVNDNPNGSTTDQVQDSDLSNLANGLWEAGATAIAVNGHRLTALSALRNSGSVIRVDGVSLSPPYQMVAIGDPRTLAARFAQTGSGSRFYDVTGALGMPTSVDNGTNLTVPAAPAQLLQLKHATYAGPTVGKNDTQGGM